MRKVYAWEIQLAPTSLSRASKSNNSSSNISLLELLPATVSSCAMPGRTGGRAILIRGAAAVCERVSFGCYRYVLVMFLLTLTRVGSFSASASKLVPLPARMS